MPLFHIIEASWYGSCFPVLIFSLCLWFHPLQSKLRVTSGSTLKLGQHNDHQTSISIIIKIILTANIKPANCWKSLIRFVHNWSWICRSLWNCLKVLIMISGWYQHQRCYEPLSVSGLWQQPLWCATAIESLIRGSRIPTPEYKTWKIISGWLRNPEYKTWEIISGWLRNPLSHRRLILILMIWERDLYTKLFWDGSNSTPYF